MRKTLLRVKRRRGLRLAQRRRRRPSKGRRCRAKHLVSTSQISEVSAPAGRTAFASQAQCETRRDAVKEKKREKEVFDQCWDIAHARPRSGFPIPGPEARRGFRERESRSCRREARRVEARRRAAASLLRVRVEMAWNKLVRLTPAAGVSA